MHGRLFEYDCFLACIHIPLDFFALRPKWGSKVVGSGTDKREITWCEMKGSTGPQDRFGTASCGTLWHRCQPFSNLWTKCAVIPLRRKRKIQRRRLLEREQIAIGAHGIVADELTGRTYPALILFPQAADPYSELEFLLALLNHECRRGHFSMGIRCILLFTLSGRASEFPGAA